MSKINNEIEQLHKLLTKGFPGSSDMVLFHRLYALGIVSAFNQINYDLEKLSEQLDSSINIEAISINFDTYLEKSYWIGCGLYAELKKESDQEDENNTVNNFQTEINRLTDYLPNGVKDYYVTPDVLNSFKTAMHQLCDEEKLSHWALEYALDKGLSRMLELLEETQRKVKKPETYLFTKLWDDIFKIYINDDYDKKYHEWVENNGGLSFEDLKIRQKQEIFNFLIKGFFRFCNTPTGAQVKNRKLKITEDDLEYGTKMPSTLDIECTKFERFFEWKEDFLSINYERLGQYIYNNHQNFLNEDFVNVTDFDRIMDLIHEDMARQKPSLAKYLKRYEENQVEELLTDCTSILSSCKPFLKSDIRESILEEYLKKLLYDPEMKAEARRKLGGQSKNKYICGIVKTLSDYFVFDVKYRNEDFAKVLYKELESTTKDTLLRYLKDRQLVTTTLKSWTSKIIDDLKQQSET